MRTTVTLDPDVAALVRKTMRERRVTFKQALDDAVRAGMATQAPFVDLPTYDMGRSRVDLTKALRLAGELEDAELAARIARATRGGPRDDQPPPRPAPGPARGRRHGGSGLHLRVGGEAVSPPRDDRGRRSDRRGAYLWPPCPVRLATLPAPAAAP